MVRKKTFQQPHYALIHRNLSQNCMNLSTKIAFITNPINSAKTKPCETINSQTRGKLNGNNFI